VIAVSKSDKKMDRGVIKFILIKEIGAAYVDRTVTEREMEYALQELLTDDAGLEYV
jgi:3-dehydroquinate synthase